MLSSETQFYCFILIMVILFVGLIVVNVRVNKLKEKTTKLQKHILYQQNILEKHHKKLVQGKDDMRENLVEAPPIMVEEELDLEVEDIIEPSTSSSSNSSVKTPPPNRNPISNLLPLVSTVMTTMMSTNDTKPNPIDTTSSTIEYLNKKDFEEEKMLSEIKSELAELKLNPEKNIETESKNIETESVISNTMSVV